jgi:hypothetical protein
MAVQPGRCNIASTLLDLKQPEVEAVPWATLVPEETCVLRLDSMVCADDLKDANEVTPL